MADQIDRDLSSFEDILRFELHSTGDRLMALESMRHALYKCIINARNAESVAENEKKNSCNSKKNGLESKSRAESAEHDRPKQENRNGDT